MNFSNIGSFRLQLSVVFTLFALFLTSCDENQPDRRNDYYSFGVNSDEDKQYNTGFNGEVKTTLGGTKTSEEFYSAPTSVRVDAKTPFAFTTHIENVKRDQHFKVSIWSKDPARGTNLIISGTPQEILYLNRPEVVEIGENGWKKLQVEFDVPPAVRSVSVYAYAPENEGYFDDLEIETFLRKKYPDLSDKSGLHLYFSQDEMTFFESERREAFMEGVHFTRDRWSKGVLSDEEIVIPIEARLKGDWLDHMQGRKWSFRVKTREDETFERMRAFSVQTPASRYFLHEYLAHQLFSSEGILTTRYAFTPMFVNTENLGVYAIEEHFAKQLVEYNLRREGPIIKFDEDPFWRILALTTGVNGDKGYRSMPIFETSRIVPFGAKKVLMDTTAHKQFLIAHSLLHQFKFGQGAIDDLFDVDKLASYLALTDLVDGKHGFIWHNMRFYYNPVLCKLEPINYDNFTEEYSDDQADLSAVLYDKNKGYPITEKLNFTFFASERVLELYLDYVERYTDPEFINSFLAGNETELKEYYDLIKNEYPRYRLPEDFLHQNATDLKAQIPELKSRIDSGYFADLQLGNTSSTTDTEGTETLIPYFVNTYYHKEGSGEGFIFLENYNGRKIELMSLLNAEKREIYSFNDVVVNEYAGSSGDTSFAMPFLESAKYALIKGVDTEDEFVAELLPWKKNTSQSPYQEIKSDSASNPNRIFSAKGDTLILRKGQYILRDKLLIPQGKTVLIESG
ncbi:MAG: CotH kinase family protein, partial [Bacteroidota bacterium]